MRPARRYAFVVAGVFVAAVAIALVLPAGQLLTGPRSDTIDQFVAWRTFAATQLVHGHLPLWNPYTYAGEPFAGGFQSALFYPPNLLFLALPLERAINLSFLLHLCWLGWGMERWVRGRGLHPIAAALAGIAIPLGGAVFPHMYAGHLSNICTMAWAPWAFVGIDRWCQEKRRRGLLLAAAAVAMQVLAGHVQYAFDLCVAAGIYALVQTIATPAARRRALPGVVVAYAAAAVLAAGQLLMGVAAAAEGLHQGKLDFSYVSEFSFPPENMLTALAPGFFGGLSTGPALVYWGRCFFWEMNFFIGVCGVLLIVVALGDRERRRGVALDLLTSALLLALAFGAHTPLLRVLYDWVPGFGSFRGLSKFAFPATLFLALVMAAGADLLIRGRLPRRGLTLFLAFSGSSIVAAGAWLWSAPGLAPRGLAWIAGSHESFLPPAQFVDPDFVRAVASGAGASLVIAGAIWLAATMSLRSATRHPVLRWVPLAILPVELLAFAGTHVGTSSLTDAMPSELSRFVAAHPGNYRVLNQLHPNNGVLLGASDAWGNDPAVLKRYAEFMTFTQGGNPDRTTQDLAFHGLCPIYVMLRLGYAFVVRDASVRVAESSTTPLPRALLVSDYRVLSGRDAMFSELTRPEFDPRQVVLLEQAPHPAPAPPIRTGTVRVVGDTTDTLELEAETDSPALLLVTDVYSRDWHARPLGNSAQRAYEILPANYVLRAVPLAAGHHHLILEYAPASFAVGMWISAIAWLAWIGLWATESGRSWVSPSAPPGSDPGPPRIGTGRLSANEHHVGGRP